MPQNITNIQRYSIHDGPGIRTTVFFKGCPLNCRWCHNPESISFEPQLMYYSERCTGCMACTAACPAGAISASGGRPSLTREKCAACGGCVKACPVGALELAGFGVTAKELVRECTKDLIFYETSGGGVTLSGGEVMAQPADGLLELLRALKREGIHIAIDTCGHAPWADFDAVLPFADLFLYDIKLMDGERHELFTGQRNDLILDNLKRLAAAGAKLHIRMPLVEGVNASDADIEAAALFLKENNIRPLKINLLAYHSIGDGKLARLGLSAEPHGFAPPSAERLDALRRIFERNGFADVQIGG